MTRSDTQNWRRQLQRDVLFAPIDRQDLMDDLLHQTEELIAQWAQASLEPSWPGHVLNPQLVGQTLVQLSRLNIIEETGQHPHTLSLQRTVERVEPEVLAQLASEWLSPSIWFDDLSMQLDEHPTNATAGWVLMMMEKLQLLRASLWSFDVMAAQTFDLDMRRVEEALGDHVVFHEQLIYHSQWIHQTASLLDPNVPEDRYFHLPWYEMLAHWLDCIESERFTESLVHALINTDSADSTTPVIDLQPYIDAQHVPDDELFFEPYQPRAAQAAKQAGQERTLRWRGQKLGWEAFVRIKDSRHQPDDAPLVMIFVKLPPKRRLRIKVGTEEIFLSSSKTPAQIHLTMGQFRQWSANNQLVPVVMERLLIDIGQRIQ